MASDTLLNPSGPIPVRKTDVPMAEGAIFMAGDHAGTAIARTLAILSRERDLAVDDNEPYEMNESDYTGSRHAYPRSLRYVEIEVRQDLLEEDFGRMADLLERALGSCTDP